MIQLRKVKEFEDGTANYTFNVDNEFIRYYIDATNDKMPDKNKIGVFIKNLIFEAVGDSYTENKSSLNSNLN
jgi:hypothetical protein